jgi:protein SCO1
LISKTSLSRRQLIVASSAVIAGTTLFGCERKAVKFNSIDITGSTFGKDFRLTDHTGANRTLADYRGKAVVLFFGFTQCPDVCPTTLSTMKEVRGFLGDRRDKLQVLFATIDPKRDSQALLAQYVPAFDASFVGLRADDAQTAQLIKDFKLVVEMVPGQTATSYTVNHTSFAYVYDVQGALRLMVDHGLGAQKIHQDILQLI